MKFLHITSSILAALLLCSCNEKIIAPVPDNLESGNGKVRYTFTVDLGDDMPSTKALTEDAQIRNMYVAVFDSAGYKLSEYVKAELASPDYGTGENDTDYRYSIELTVSNTPRTLHFIANAPKSLSYGSESEVIGSLYTSLENDDENTFQESYWQRIELPNIPEKPVMPDESDYEGNTEAYNAALASYNTKMESYDLVANQFNGIKLIRNYSKLTLRKAAKTELDNFEILGMWLINYPDRGTLAPYNRNTGKFMDDYLDYTTVEDVEDVTKGNYQGFMLATTNFILPENAAYFEDETSVNSHMIASADEATCTTIGYVYEREKALESPMYIIMKAKYDGAPCYYKIALQDNEGNFYSMLRNFNYLIEVQSVSCAGKGSAWEALLGTPSGDISLNVEFKEITSISDGEARLSVSNTTLMLVGAKGSSITVNDLWYKYEPTASSIANGLYDNTNKVGVEITYDETGASGPVIHSLNRADADNAGGMRLMTLVTEPVSDVHKTQTITITGMHLDGKNMKTITRKIDLILREQLNMHLSTGPNTDTDKIGHIKKNQNEPLTVTIGIESGLPESIFPLKFNIEAARRTLTPDGDVMPVESGTSTIMDPAVLDAGGFACKGRPSFWFVKTISWDDYNSVDAIDGIKSFTAKFKNNKTDEETEHIYVSQNYFNQSSVDLIKYTEKTFSGISFQSEISVGAEGTFSFNLAGGIPASGKVRIGLARFEEAKTSGTYTSKLEYLHSEIIDGDSYDIYEMPVSTADNTLKLVAFEKGTGHIILWADEYGTEKRNASIN